MEKDKKSEAMPQNQTPSLLDVTILPSKKIVTPKIIRAGMFAYADGLIFPEIVDGNQITSVVGYVGKTEGLSICLKRKRLPWSGDMLYVGMKADLSGKEATNLILLEANLQHKQAEAARYCFAYAENGVEKGSAFLASAKELERIYRNKNLVNKALAMLETACLEKECWSASECSCSCVETQDFSNGCRRNAYKGYDTLYVHPVLAFKR